MHPIFQPRPETRTSASSASSAPSASFAHAPHRLTGAPLALLTALALVGCQAAASTASPPATDPTPTSRPTPDDPNPTDRTPTPALAADASKAWLLVGKPGEPGLQVILSTTAEVQIDVPAGAPRPRWERVVTATADGPDRTIVRDTIVQPGSGGPELSVAGSWQLPTVGLDPVPVGRSIDGSTIALVEPGYGGTGDPTPGLSRFAILEHAIADTVQTSGDAPLRLARIVELAGDFEYDALSPDGRILYVAQHLDESQGGRYQVRAVDVASGVMRDAVIVDKADPDEEMSGTPIAQLRRPDGLVLTLYRGPEHPFVHALMSPEAWAICIDLPSGAPGVAASSGNDREAASRDWDLAASPDGRSVYAVNATLGIAADIDPTQFAVRRTASIGTPTTGARDETPAAGPVITLAKFGHSDVGPTGRRAVVSEDGSMLYVGGSDGIVAIRTRDLVTVRRDLAGSAIDGIGLTTPGTVLFALVWDGGAIVALDAADGERLGTVPGGPYDRLLAVAPW